MRELLSTAFSTYRQHFWLIASLTFVVWLPCDLIQSYCEYNVFDEENTGMSLRMSRFFASFGGIIASAGILHSLDLSAAGVTPTFKSAIGAGFAYWPRMWFANFLFGLAAIFGLILLIVPGVIVFVRCSILEPIVVRESVTGVTAIQRSFALTKGRFWQLAGWFLVAGLASSLAVIIIGTLFLVPAFDWWLADAIISSLSAIPAAFITVFGWAVLNFLQEKEQQSQPPPL